MKIIKNSVYSPNRSISIALLSIAGFMLLISLFSLTLNFSGDIPTIELSFNNLSSLVSIFPLTFGVGTVLLMKTKKVVFAKLPSYIVCLTLAIGYILYFISLGEDNLAGGFIALMFIALLVYPFVIAVLTIEGRVYNRVFATSFTGVLIFVSTTAFVLISIYTKSISLSFLLPALIYVELLLTVLSFKLEPIKKEKSDYDSIL